jgi:predicted glycosyltransferase
MRIALYSHDTMGLGHMRRNLSIARTLSASSLKPDVLMIAGANIATGFAMPAGVDCLTLPGLYKDIHGNYQCRSLGLDLSELTRLRSKTIRSALSAYQPDVLIVDNVPRGVNAELNETLELMAKRPDTHCVLGLRDILDEPEVVRKEWQRCDNEDAIRNYFSAVWVYGDPRLYDPAQEYRFDNDIRNKISFTGYLNGYQPCADAGEQHRVREDLDFPPGDIALCMAGGGQDGGLLARLFCDPGLRELNRVILTGPYMPLSERRELHASAANDHSLRVLDFHPEPTRLIGCASRVVTMGGYNTISEVLSMGKKALVVPRIQPRREQYIRAERLAELGLIDLLHPDKANAETVTSWLLNHATPGKQVHELLDFNGLSRLPLLLDSLIKHGVSDNAAIGLQTVSASTEHGLRSAS